MYSHTTTALLALFAASSLATPVRNDRQLEVDQHSSSHGQLPFLVQEQSSNKLTSLADSGVQAYPGLPSLNSFRGILTPPEHAKLVQHVESLPEQRIIELSEFEQDRYTITEGQKALLTFHGIKFIDVTDAFLSGVNAQAIMVAEDNNDAASYTTQHFPSNWTYGRDELQSKFYDNIDTSRMKSFLQAFSSFRTRYYRSSEGRQSQLFLLEKIHEIVSDKKNDHLKMTVEEFKHSWGQNSIIVRLPAQDKANAKGTIVVGAHQDSTNLLPFLSAP